MAVRTTDATSSAASTPGTLTLTTSATRVLAANAKRRSLTIQNTSAVVVYIGYGAGLTTANGIQLQPGDTLGEKVYTGAIYAMSASGSPALPYIEVGL